MFGIGGKVKRFFSSPKQEACQSFLDPSQVRPPTPDYPETCTLSLTNICQQRCRFCGYDHEQAARNPFFLSPETVKKMTWLGNTKHITICGNGEALVHPGYAEIISSVRKNAPSSTLMLYTNGLGLHGDKLKATIHNVDKIFISQNAVTYNSYNTVIQKGSHKLAMKNLEQLSKNRGNIHVTLSIVVCTGNASDIIPMIDTAANLGFQNVMLKTYSEPKNNFSGKEFGISYYDIATNEDVKKLKIYAKQKKVELLYDATSYWQRNKCMDPFTHIQFNVMPNGKVDVNYCCYGSSNIYTTEKIMQNLDQIWKNSRIEMIRDSVNNRYLLYKNKMCLVCRLVDRFASTEQKRVASESLGIDYAMQPRPSAFPLLELNDAEGMCNA